MSWDAVRYDERFSFVTAYGNAALTRLQPRPGERILDLGCGTGHHAAAVAAAGASVEGLDADEEMLRKARREHPEVTFRQADARTFTVAERVHAVFSNAALHWVVAADQGSMLDRVHAALLPGGRFVAEVGGAGNVSVILQAVEQVRGELGLPAATSPWCFPTPGQQASRLEQAGFRVRSLDHFDRPSELGAGDTPASWLRMFGRHLTCDVPEAHRTQFDREVDQRTAAALRGHDGRWRADYVRLRWYATA